jgi:succinate dehydrogenase/fumarate reductase cytochrome b subunit
MKSTKPSVLPMILWGTQLILGIGIVSFVLVEHLPGLSTIIIGKSFFESYTELLHSFPELLINLVIIALFSAIAVHGFVNFRTIAKIYRKPDQALSYAVRFKHSHTWYWILQCITGSLLAFFVTVHFWITHMMIPPGEKLVDFIRTNTRLGNNWYILFYIGFLTFLLYHSLNGTRAVLVKLGIATTKKQEMLVIVLALLGFAFFGLLGLVTLYFFRIR